MDPRNLDPAFAGVLAAELLAEACRPGSGDDLRLETVRGLATDSGRRLASLSGPSGEKTPDSLVEAALVCADLATLASCNLTGLPDQSRSLATAATHLAAGTALALLALVEAGIGEQESMHARNVLRDARSAGWKADLAVRQLDDTG